MGLLTALASLLGIETEAIVRRLKESAVAVAAIALFALIAIVFLLVALYTWLAGWLGPIWAPLIIAGVALLFALILVVALSIQRRATARREAERKRARETTALVTSAAVSALPGLLESGLLRNVGLPLGLLAAFLYLSRPKHDREDEGD